MSNTNNRFDAYSDRYGLELAKHDALFPKPAEPIKRTKPSEDIEAAAMQDPRWHFPAQRDYLRLTALRAWLDEHFPNEGTPIE